MTAKQKVIVAGAGPVGLLTALALARQDIEVTVLEAEPGLTVDLRAGSFHPPTLEMMAPYGITDEMHRTGIRVPHWQIRDRKQGLIVGWDIGEIADLTPYPYRLHLEQHKLTPIIDSFVKKEPNARVRYSHEVTGVEQTGDKVIVTAKTPGGEERFEADWLVGCDGGKSAVRKAIGVELEGFTWPERFVVISSTVDLAQTGFTPNAYVADPKEWCAIFKMPGDGPPGLWRAAFPAQPEESDEETLSEERVEERMQGLQAIPGRYPISYKSIYKVHQRVAKRFRVGRVILAGDACHLNNPIGGFGLNGGIHDAITLAGKLGPVCRGEGDDSMIDHYERQRRTVNIEYVQEHSIRNLKRLIAKTDEEREKNFAELRKAASTPESRRQFLLVSTMIASVQRANAIE